MSGPSTNGTRSAAAIPADYDYDAALKRAMAESLKDEEKRKPKGPIHPVSGLVPMFSKRLGISAGTVVVRTATDTDFWYYNCGGEMDTGWGCTYRAIQMVVSNLLIRSGKPKQSPPSLRAIQETLSRCYPDRYPVKTTVGSRLWLEPPDARRFFEAGAGVTGRDATYNVTSDAKALSALWVDAWDHFHTHRTPVIFDDKVKTYAVLGVGYRSDQKFVLVFDPHVYSSKSLNFGMFVRSEGQCVEWKRLETHFKNGTWMALFPRAKPEPRRRAAAAAKCQT